MKDYASMSDFEINKSVALALGFRLYKDGKSCRENHVAIEEGRCGAFNMDWCNNPADAWPILLENHIAVVPYRHTQPQAWPTAFGVVSKFTTEDANPLRAGMVTFLKMKESENA